MLPIIVDNTDALGQETIAQAVIKICEQDEVNRLALRIFVDKYGAVRSETFGTSFNEEMKKFSLLDVLYHKSAEEA